MNENMSKEASASTPKKKEAGIRELKSFHSSINYDGRRKKLELGDGISESNDK